MVSDKRKPTGSEGISVADILSLVLSLSATIMFWWALTWMLLTFELTDWILFLQIFPYMWIVLITGGLGFGLFIFLFIKLVRGRL